MTRLEGFEDGAVRRPTDPALLRHLEGLWEAVPHSRAHAQAFERLGSACVYARPIAGGELPGLQGVWLVLVRFGLKIETTFGLTREVLLLYSPHRDLQSRTFHAVPDIMTRLPREVTSDVVMLCTPDPRQDQKLRDWSSGHLTAVPLPVDLGDEERAPYTILERLRQRLFTRDLYAETSPVSGSGFFGRETLLQSLRDDISSRRVAGIFGLRKTGKTSLLKQLARVLQDEDSKLELFVMRDLESLPSLPEDVIAPLALDLRADLRDAFRQRGLRTQELSELGDSFDLSSFKRALLTCLRRQPDGVSLVLALDEVEYLCPPNRMDVDTVETQRIPQFLGVLRSLVQETDKFTFLLSGLASASIEEGLLFGRHNPLFSWAKPYYLPPFTRDESASLLRGLGEKMGIEWDDAAIDVVFAESGGHPYLLRDLASTVTRRVPLSAGKRLVNRGTAHQYRGDWRRSVDANVREMLTHIERYYPTEAVMLEFLRSEEPGFQDLAQAEPSAVHHLIQLGLVRTSSAGLYEASPLLILVS